MTTSNPCKAGIQCLQSIETIPGNGPLTVNHVSYSATGPAAQFLDESEGIEAAARKSAAWHRRLRAAFDSETPTEVTLTSDGRHYNRAGGWHTGPEAEAVYVERWTPEGRVFHGFIDSVSRRLVQAG